MQLENVRKLEIQNGTISDSTARFRGGGINHICEDDNEDCQWYLMNGLAITNNKALEGGGYFARDVIPNYEPSEI